jgi:hypothetical protein
MPDFVAFGGTPSDFCSLLDINPALDLDSNPRDGIVDASTATLVGRIPRPVPGKPGYYVCAIAPAGGFVKVKNSAGLFLPDPVRYAYTADTPNTFVTCSAGGFLYKLGAVGAPNDAASDKCMQCPRGSYATSAASLCAPCELNFYQDKPGQRSCKPCQFGYAPYQGAARCLNCYYGRPFCSEGFTPNDNLFTCNSVRLPDGYSPEGGFSMARAQKDPTAADAAARYAPMFKNCNVRGGAATLLGLNVSAECRVDMYVLGDLGSNGGQCSQNAEANAITAYYTGGPGGRGGVGACRARARFRGPGGLVPGPCAYGALGPSDAGAGRHDGRSLHALLPRSGALRPPTRPRLHPAPAPPSPTPKAPNMLASMSSRGIDKFTVGFTGVLDADGMPAKIFATSTAGSRVPDDLAAPTQIKLVVRRRAARASPRSPLSPLAALCYPSAPPARRAARRPAPHYTRSPRNPKPLLTPIHAPRSCPRAGGATWAAATTARARTPTSRASTSTPARPVGRAPRRQRAAPWLGGHASC